MAILNYSSPDIPTALGRRRLLRMIGVASLIYLALAFIEVFLSFVYMDVREVPIWVRGFCWLVGFPVFSICGSGISTAPGFVAACIGNAMVWVVAGTAAQYFLSRKTVKGDGDRERRRSPI